MSTAEAFFLGTIVGSITLALAWSRPVQRMIDGWDRQLAAWLRQRREDKR